MLAGVFTSVAGIIMASRLNSAQPALGAGYELEAIAAVVIGGTSLSGGKGTILGTVIGCIDYECVNKWSSNPFRTARVANSSCWSGYLISSLRRCVTKQKSKELTGYCFKNKTIYRGVLDEESKKGIVLSSILAISMFMGACSSNNASTGSKDSDAPAKDNGKRYVAIISKGFQHQFWQAVKKGAEQAADEYKVNITFVGPETEAQVDKQVEMLRSTLDKNQMRLVLRH